MLQLVSLRFFCLSFGCLKYLGSTTPIKNNIVCPLDESWLDVTPEELDGMMLGVWGNQQQQQTKNKQTENDVCLL